MLIDQIHLLEAVLLIRTHDLFFYNKSLLILDTVFEDMQSVW